MGVGQMGVAVSIQIDQGNLSIVFIMLFLASYQATIGCYFWNYVAVVSNEAQNSVASVTLWAGVLFFSLTSNTIIKALGQIVIFYSFGGICLFGGLIFILYLKETKGLSKEEMLYLYNTRQEEPEVQLRNNGITNESHLTN